MGRREKKKEVNSAVIIPGIVLISLGLIFLLTDLNVITFNPFYIILLIGVIFLLAYFFSNNWGLLIPGVIITLISIVLLTGYSSVWYVWPGIVGIAFLIVYLTKQDNTDWAIIPGGILLGVTLIASFEYYTNINLFSVLLIIAGLYILYKNYKK